MVTIVDIPYAVADATGFPESTVRTIVRHLGESGAIPRGLRGQAAPDARPVDIALVLIAVLYIADGIGGTAARVAQAVDQIGGLTCQRDLVAEVTDPGGARKMFSIVSGTPFREAIASIIEYAADLDEAQTVRQAINAVGLTFGRDAKLGWIEASQSANFTLDWESRPLSELGSRPRLIFGSSNDDNLSGVVREARLNTDALIILTQRIFIPSSAASHIKGTRGQSLSDASMQIGPRKGATNG